MNRLLPTSLLLIVSLSLVGCDNFNRNTKVITTTLGKEISDLKAALDQGAIDEEQYRKLLDEVIKKRMGSSSSLGDKGPVKIVISGDEN